MQSHRHRSIPAGLGASGGVLRTRERGRSSARPDNRGTGSAPRVGGPSPSLGPRSTTVGVGGTAARGERRAWRAPVAPPSQTTAAAPPPAGDGAEAAPAKRAARARRAGSPRGGRGGRGIGSKVGPADAASFTLGVAEAGPERW